MSAIALPPDQILKLRLLQLAYFHSKYLPMTFLREHLSDYLIALAREAEIETRTKRVARTSPLHLAKALQECRYRITPNEVIDAIAELAGPVSAPIAAAIGRDVAEVLVQRRHG